MTIIMKKRQNNLKKQQNAVYFHNLEKVGGVQNKCTDKDDLSVGRGRSFQYTRLSSDLRKQRICGK